MPMKLSLCNEVLRELEFARQCALAAELGYRGLELAPFTLGEEAYRMPAPQRAQLRRAVQEAGIAVSGLHWLLVAPPGLSITSADDAVRERTLEVLRRLIELCAELGGDYLVHGSPAQRRVGDQADPAAAAARAEAIWAAVAADAAAAGVVYCIEPLARPEADFVNTIAEAADIVQRIGAPALRTMIDTSAAGRWKASRSPTRSGAGCRAGSSPMSSSTTATGAGRARAPTASRRSFARLSKRAIRAGWRWSRSIIVRTGRPARRARIGYVSGLLEALA